MNGRIYDPVLARFISADPNIDGADDAQGYNRFSYVGNNPLNATDPSGYFKFKDALKIVAVVAIAYFTAGWAIGAFGVGTATASTGMATVTVTTYGSGLASSLTLAGFSAGVINGAIGGLAAGFASGFAGSLLNGGSVGDAFKAGVVGGVAGAITGGIAGKIGDVFGDVASGSFGNEFERALAHGATGGLAEEVQGGQFRHGFYSGFIGSVSGSIVGRSSLVEMDGGSGVFARTAIAATAGGTASAISGGKFANGAVTGAFQHLFNFEGHLERRQDRRIEAYRKGEITQEQLFELYQNDAVVGLGGLAIMSGAAAGPAALSGATTMAGSAWGAVNSASTAAYVYVTTQAGQAAAWFTGATGGLYQWFRLKGSYSHHMQQNTSLTLSWGASPKHAWRIGNETLRNINQWFRQLRIPINSWRTNDPGHLHIKK